MLGSVLAVRPVTFVSLVAVGVVEMVLVASLVVRRKGATREDALELACRRICLFHHCCIRFPGQVPNPVRQILVLSHVTLEVRRRPADVLTYTGSLALEPIAGVTVIALNVQGQETFDSAFVATTRVNARKQKHLDSVDRSLVKSEPFLIPSCE